MHKHPYQTDVTLMEQAGRFFPDFSDEQRARWIAAKQYVAGRFTIPIGERAVDNTPPDFLRALPRPQTLNVETDPWGYAMEMKRLIESKLA